MENEPKGLQITPIVRQKADRVFNRTQVVIAGSYLKENWDVLRNLAQDLELQGIQCFPHSMVTPLHMEDGFVLMTPDLLFESRDEVQRAFFYAISKADVLVVQPGRKDHPGRIGRTVAHELGYALVCNKPIAITNPITELAEDVPERLADIIQREMKNFSNISSSDLSGENRRESLLSRLKKSKGDYSLTLEEKKYILDEIDVLLADFAKGKF